MWEIINIWLTININKGGRKMQLNQIFQNLLYIRLRRVRQLRGEQMLPPLAYDNRMLNYVYKGIPHEN